MFHRERDASKVALVHLTHHLRPARISAVRHPAAHAAHGKPGQRCEILAPEYLVGWRRALEVPATFGSQLGPLPGRARAGFGSGCGLSQLAAKSCRAVLVQGSGFKHLVGDRPRAIPLRPITPGLAEHNCHENSFDDDSERAAQRRRGHWRRRPGDVGQHDHEGRRDENPPPDGRQGDHRLCRQQRRRLCLAGAVRGQAEGLSVQRSPRRHRAGQGMAHRSRPAAAGGAAGRGRRPAHAAGHRQRRRDSAHRRHAGDRLGRQLRRGRGPGTDRPIAISARPRSFAGRWRSPPESTSTRTATSSVEEMPCAT